jgi:ABC-type multidrug transport system fused ATPase/permease subunit
MPKLQMFIAIFKKHKWQLVLTYALFSVEMLALLMQPYFLGRAIDGLIYGNNIGLFELIFVYLVWVIMGTIRHRIDTRTYTGIYTSFVSRLLNRKYDEKDVSKLAAHSNLAREFVDFLEFDLVYVIEAAYNIIGSLILLCFYDTKVVLICLSVLIPVSIISFFYGKKMKYLTLKRNDELENQVDIIGVANPISIKKHYNNLRLWQIKISDQEAWNFGAMGLLVLLIVAVSLYVTSWVTHTEEIAASNLIVIFMYVKRYGDGLDTIPYTVQRISNLTDIAKRMQLSEEDLFEHHHS